MVIQKVKSIFYALSMAMLVFSQGAFADVSGTLDNITENATFTYTGGDGRKLSQIGRHAYSFGRIRFSNTTSAVNVVNLTPPSITPPNCSSININLGSFDVISLDEAVAILRRIASEALTYGSGLALQSMCSPCWTAMKTLQTQLERLNLANRNTCTMVKSFIDEKTDNGKVFDLRRYICQGEANQTGDDPYNCGLEDSSLATTIADGWDTFITTVEAMAGDPDAKFMYGNVVAEAFLKTQGIAAIPDSVFPSDLSTLILGSPTVDNPTTPAHTGISVTEASMNLFGYYYVGPVDDNENATSGYVPSPIPSLDKIIETKIVNCEGANCHKLLQCNDVTVTGTSGNTHTLACGGHVETEASYADTIALYNAETTCTDKEAEPNLVEVLRCFVQGAYTKLEQGDYTNLTSLQQKIIQASPVEVIRAYSIGTDQDKGALTKIMGGHLSKYLAYSMLNNYVADLAQLTTFLLEKGNKEIAIEDSQVRQIHQEIRVKLEQASILKQKADENLAELMKSVEYVNIIERYSKSMSRQVSDHLTKRN